ncbi:TPA: hypothetical protein DCZ39_03680 [Patescibacteria group bacterium]|nr:hypothetical protein [Candidatus Gracilibacteria bacterium]
MYDICFISANNKKPDRKILKKIHITTPQQLKERILEKVHALSLPEMQEDLAYFIFDPNDTRVLRFKEIIQQTEFEQ